MSATKPTQSQLKDVEFCESVLGIEFTGDRESIFEVSDFLSLYLDDANEIMDDAISSYYSNFDY